MISIVSKAMANSGSGRNMRLLISMVFFKDLSTRDGGICCLLMRCNLRLFARVCDERLKRNCPAKIKQRRLPPPFASLTLGIELQLDASPVGCQPGSLLISPLRLTASHLITELRHTLQPVLEPL